MKKIIIFGIIGVLLIYGFVFYYKYVYVPTGQEFDVKFSNLKEGEVKGLVDVEKVELTDHGLYTRSKFMKSGDSFTYTFDVTNDGTINAELKAEPIKMMLDQYFKSHIVYEITYADGSRISKGDMLNVGDVKTFKVTITYKRSADMATQDSQFYESNIYLLYLQKR
ncbi:MAG: hypothetical protein IJ572_02175 [Bacilli bacterium]|nr:hypothetical protein [Bacilli bacterium]